MNNGVLYISYDGVLEPLGQSQVLAYVERLAARRPIHLISFEKPRDWVELAERTRVACLLEDAGIHWYPLRYHKRPTAFATAWDILCGVIVGWWLVVRYRLAIVHARSYVPSVMALVLKRIAGVKYLFDMRGFWADERVDGNLWPRQGRMYALAKGFEGRFLLAADHVVSLTQAAVNEMRRFPYLQRKMPTFTVIPTCADLARFRPPADKDEGFVLGYVGSAGTWYLFNEVAACAARMLKLLPGARFLIVNRGEHKYVRDTLAAAGVPPECFELVSATYAEVPRQIARMNAGIFFIRPMYSKQASAPTKLAEFLGCGVPCLSNGGVGDMAQVLESERVGVAIDGFGQAALDSGLKALMELVDDPDTSVRCVNAARKHFSLDEGVSRYERVYEQLDGLKR